MGRLTNMVDAVGTTKYTYANGLLATEDGPWANDTVAWDYNTARKRSALRLQQTAIHWWTNSYAWDTSHRLVDWYPTSTERFVYDGMLVVQERNTSAPTVSYTRGVDLSGSLNGAGGIGGLLARSHGFSTGSGTWSTHSAYHADGNGNVTGMFSTSTGSQVGWYRYDAFGRLLQSSGTLASANRMRFSSKPWMAPGVDASAGLYYCGYRFYDPNTQRWVNRDPIGELGGVNIYSFVSNNPLVSVDYYGLQDGQVPTDKCKERCHAWINALIAGGAGGFDFRQALLECLEGCDRDPNYVPVVRSRRSQKRSGKTTEEIRYYISSLEPEDLTPKQWLKLIRGHWAGVENRNHWRRDALMGEDRSRSRNRSLLTNLALIRNGLLRVLNRCFPGDSIPVIQERIQAKPSLAFKALEA